MTSMGRSVGFVLHADDAPKDRWQAVRERLLGLGLELPPDPPEDGFEDQLTVLGARVEIWPMPDNQQSGVLEDLPRDPFGRENALIHLAQTSTKNAREIVATFSRAHEDKRELHRWLAWQQTSGLPYGAATTARYSLRESVAAFKFVARFRCVFIY